VKFRFIREQLCSQFPLGVCCEVLEVIPNERLSFAWRGGDDADQGYGSRLDTIVTWTLAKVPGGTRLRLVHSGFDLPRNETAYTRMSAGWTNVVGKIGDLADVAN